MDKQMDSRIEKMRKLQEELLAVEADRLAGCPGVSPEELESCLKKIIDEVEHEKEVKKDDYR